MRAVVETAGEPTFECLQIVLTTGADGLGSRLRIDIGVAGVGDEEVWSGQGDWKVQESIGHQTADRRRAAMSRLFTVEQPAGRDAPAAPASERLSEDRDGDAARVK